ncbi:MAG: tail fiber domain-containing protein, partial [Alphaproteobacteria bacterium]|nr:tail fiber domain-containing protein [Alphaproteobacteria bacterium]
TDAFMLSLPANRTTATCDALRGRYDAVVSNVSDVSDFCDFLPPGFTSATTNPYGQSYEIRVRKIAGATDSPASAFEFLILTRGGDTIPDSQGGRIASRTYVSSEYSSGQPWLARLQVPGDSTRVFNTAITRITFGNGADLNFTGTGIISGTANSNGFTMVNNDAGSTLTLSNLTATDARGPSDPEQSPAMTILRGDVNADNSQFNFYGANGVRYIYQSSDTRLKTDIVPLHDQLDRLTKLSTVHFKWKDTHQPSYGLVAQNVEELYPELVATDNKGFKAVEYDKLVPVVIQALRELKADNDQLRLQVQKLEGKLQEH